MKTISKLVLVLFVILGVSSCEKAIDITDPIIIIDDASQNFYAYDTLHLRVIESASIDGDTIPAESFEWKIQDVTRNAVVLQTTQTTSPVNWLPIDKGQYIISVKITYDENKTVTKIKDIVVKESPNSFLKRISGKWAGAGLTIFASFDVDSLVIEPSGKFHSNASNWNSSSYNGSGVFYMHANDPNHKHNYIEIQSVDDFGNVEGFVSLRSYYQGDTVNYFDYQMCIKYIRLNNTEDSLYISVDDGPSCNMYPWYVRHSLAKVQ